MPRTDLGGSPPNPQLISALTLRCIAALACGVSLALTLRFCLGLRTSDDIAATILACAMGVCWEMAKWAFAAASIACLRSRRREQIAGGLALAALSVSLIIGSLGASLSYLQQRSAEAHEYTLTQSRQYQDLTARLDGLDAELATMRATAAQDSQHGYRARALRTLVDARDLAEQRDTIAAQRDAVPASGVPASGVPVLASLSTVLGMDTAALLLCVNLLIAVLFEAIGATAVVMLGASSAPVRVSTAAAEPDTEHRPSRSTPVPVGPQAVPASGVPVPAASAPVPSDVTVLYPSTDADTYSRARELVVSGGLHPSVRSLKKTLRIGQARASRLLRALCEEQILDKRGHGFQLRACA